MTNLPGPQATRRRRMVDAIRRVERRSIMIVTEAREYAVYIFLLFMRMRMKMRIVRSENENRDLSSRWECPFF
jgi:hypothetical protein